MSQTKFILIDYENVHAFCGCTAPDRSAAGAAPAWLTPARVNDEGASCPAPMSSGQKKPANPSKADFSGDGTGLGVGRREVGHTVATGVQEFAGFAGNSRLSFRCVAGNGLIRVIPGLAGWSGSSDSRAATYS